MSGALMMAAAMGGPEFALAGAIISDVDGTACSASVRINSDGSIDKITTNGGTVALTPWATAGGMLWPQAPGLMQVRATLSSGDAPTSGDALDTWINIADDPIWTTAQVGTGTRTSNLLLELRGGGGHGGTGSPGPVIRSGTFTLDCEVV